MFTLNLRIYDAWEMVGLISNWTIEARYCQEKSWINLKLDYRSEILPAEEHKAAEASC